MRALGQKSIEIIDEIEDKAEAGLLRVPSLPEIALQIRRAVQDKNITTKKLAKIVQLDPALVLRLIQAVNSPMYRGQKTIDDCPTAIGRLGFVTTQNLVTSFALRQVYHSKSPVIRDMLRGIWRESGKVAAISSILAQVTPRITPDKALLAGLLHRIGAVPILHYMEKATHFENNRALISEVIEGLAGRIGAKVLRDWNFDAELTQIPLQISNWRYEPEQAANYVDIVIVAKIHNGFGSREAIECPPLTQVASFQKLPLAKLGPDASLELLQGAQGQFQQLIALLAPSA